MPPPASPAGVSPGNAAAASAAYPPPPPMPARTARREAPYDAPGNVVRWGLCFTMVAGVHAAAAAALLWMPPEADSGFVAGAAVVMVNLPEMPAATPTPPQDAAPGPEQPPSEAIPKPKEETKPPEQKTEVALPEPEPPKPEPPAEERQATAPPQVLALPTEAPSTAGVEEPQPPSPAVLLRWQSGLTAQIARAKRYPPRAAEHHEYGTVKVTFRIDDDGRVLESRILESSGWPELDKEAVETPARAQPFAKPPPGTRPEEHWIIVPLVFAPSKSR
jgi:periplasmic protein TonB